MSPALPDGQHTNLGVDSDEKTSEKATSAVSRLMESRRSAVEKLSLALDDVSERLHLTTTELAEERACRAKAETLSQDVQSELHQLKKRYAVLHSGLIRVLSQKFPEETSLSIENRMEALLLASNSGADLGQQPNLVTSEGSKFIQLISDSL